MHDFKKLTVWEKAMEMVVNVYASTRQFPSSERFNLVSQINRSAVSIPSNIAEGAGRKTKGEFMQSLGIASGSCTELETQLILAFRLDFLPQEQFNQLSGQLNEVTKMLFNLSRSLEK